MNPLDKGTLRSILTEPKNAIIKQYHKLFEMDGIELVVTTEALDFIVEQAIIYKLGARGLRSLCEAILTDAMFEMPGTDETFLSITRKYAEKKLNKSTINGRAYNRSYCIECGAYVFKCNNSSIKSRLLESLGTLCWPPNLFFCLSQS
jgi:ATP-dependent protease Clp ATPase subunit